MAKSLEDLTGAMRQSLEEQAAANAPSLVEPLLKQFDEFTGDLQKAVGALAPPAPEQASALDHFGLALAQMKAAITDIESGRCQAVAGLTPSADALALCKAASQLGELALRGMALEFAAPIGEGEQPTADETLLKVAGVEGEILVKTVLPRESAEILLAAPEVLDEELAGLGIELLAAAGVGPDDLAKAFPMKGKPKGEDEGAEEDEGEEEEGAEEEGAEGEEGEEEDEDGDDPEEGMPEFAPEGEGEDGPTLDNVAKLATGILIELGELQAMMPAAEPAGPMPGAEPGAEGGEPGMEGGDEIMGAIQGMAHLATLIATQADALQRVVDATSDDEADAYAEKVAKAMELSKAAQLRLPVSGEALQKRATAAETKAAELEAELAKNAGALSAHQATIDELKKQIEDLSKQAGAPRGATLDVRAVTKEADAAGAPAVNDLDRVEDLWKRDPKAGQHEIFKLALSRPLGR